MKRKFYIPAFLMMGWLILTPFSVFGQHTVCLPAGAPASALTCAFEVKPLSLSPLTAGLPYVSKSDRAQTPYATYLYPESNAMPADHLASGKAIAASLQPLNARGNVDLANGKIVVVVEGMSNTYYETAAFIQQFVQNNPALNPKLTVINEADPGCHLICWTSRGVGVIDPQVQIVLMKHSNNTPQLASGMPENPIAPFTTIASKRFPGHALTTKDMLKTRLLDVKKKYPNLKLFFLTSRSFGGWTCDPAITGYREPVAFEEGFSAKWLIEDQILGKDSTLAFNGPNAKAPWLAWGPYLWNSTWTRTMFSDGAHPCPPGQFAVAQQWYDFLMQDSTARPWFRDNVLPTTPAQLTPKVISTSRIDLSWNAATDNSGSVKYKIFRGGALLRTTAATTYADAGLNPATLYCYTISAIDSACNESKRSAQVCATTSTTGIANETSVPLEFALLQNHPNPFYPATEIRFELPAASYVVVKIYNTVGEEVRTLVDAPRAAGSHTVRWDGTDSNGNPAANGVYLYQLRSSTGSGQVKRMTLLR